MTTWCGATVVKNGSISGQLYSACSSSLAMLNFEPSNPGAWGTHIHLPERSHRPLSSIRSYHSEQDPALPASFVCMPCRVQAEPIFDLIKEEYPKFLFQLEEVARFRYRTFHLRLVSVTYNLTVAPSNMRRCIILMGSSPSVKS